MTISDVIPCCRQLMVRSLLARKSFKKRFQKFFNKWNTKVFVIKRKVFFFLIKNLTDYFQCIQFSNLPGWSVSVRNYGKAPFFVNIQLNCFVSFSVSQFSGHFSDCANFHSAFDHSSDLMFQMIQRVTCYL